MVAPEKIRESRLLARGLSREEARRRMASQMKQLEKSERADFGVDNGSDLQTTRRQVLRLHEALLLDLEALNNCAPLPPPPSI